MAPPRRGTSARPSANAKSAPLPKGSRVPQPMLVYWIVRTIFIGALVLFFASPTILTWAAAQRLPPSGQQRGGLLTGLLLDQRPTAADQARDQGDRGAGVASDRDTFAPLLAAAAFTVLTPHVVAALGKIGILGVCVMLGEVLLACWGMWKQRRTMPRMPITYLLVRATLPSFSPSSGRMGGSSTPSGDQFFRAIQQAIPRGTRSERFAGRAPWVAFTLTGIPDTPIEMGIVVADPKDTRRAETAMALRAIIQGQLPGAQIDAVPDPFLTALTPGVTVAWREYGLKLPPHFPLRFLDDIEGSDLLGPFAAALAPRGSIRTEAQIIVRPATSWVLNWGWRGHATALRLKLEAKADYALTDDTKAIEAKLGAAPFEATIRIAIAAAGAESAAQLELGLNQIAEVLGQYHQRTSHHLQTVVPIGAGRITIADDYRGRTCSIPTLIHTRAPRFAPPPALLLPLRTWRQSAIQTSNELAGFWHPPVGGLGNLVRWLPCKMLAPPPQAYIAPGRADRIMVGMAKRADGTIGPVGPTLRDLRPPLHITAGMGAGKSRALANICQQAVPHGFILLDGKGDDQGGSLAATVRTAIPLADEHRLIIFDILDTDWPIGLNPLAGIDLTRPGAKDQALGQIMAIFARLDPATWGRAPAMKEFVQMATLLILEGEPHPTLAHVKQCLLD
ncbi:MAG: ATP-binding protein, partial [Roseiflexaceae bacterium]